MTPLTERFVHHFGEMGGRWGINRTVGQIYALLFVSASPLCADDLVENLGISRSNVSMGLKELQGWNLIHTVRHPGDRRDYFQTPEDVWTIFKTLADERRRREIAPTLTMLRDALMEHPESETDRHAQERMQQMYDLIELVTDWFHEVNRLSPQTIEQLMRLGGRISRLLNRKSVEAGHA